MTWQEDALRGARRIAEAGVTMEQVRDTLGRVIEHTKQERAMTSNASLGDTQEIEPVPLTWEEAKNRARQVTKEAEAERAEIAQREAPDVQLYRIRMMCSEEATVFELLLSTEEASVAYHLADRSAEFSKTDEMPSMQVTRVEDIAEEDMSNWELSDG